MGRPLVSTLKAAPNEQNPATAELRGRYLVLARAAWFVVAGLTLVYLVVAIPDEFTRLQTICETGKCDLGELVPANVHDLRAMGLSVGFFAAYVIAIKLFFAAFSFVVGVVIFWRRPEEPVAFFVALTLVAFGSLAFSEDFGAITANHLSLQWVFAPVIFVGNIFAVLLLYLFPEGRFVPHWTRWLALALIALGICFHFFPDSSLSRWLTSPLGVALSVGFVATGVFAQIYRYLRVSRSLQRQQTKWAVFGIATAMVASQATQATFAMLPRPHVILLLLAYTILTSSLLLVPISIGFAILRYRLWDIDLIINRTLVYTALTAGVIGLYVLVVGSVGVILQVQGNLLVSILAAGLVAVMFQPLRERLQRAVNRLMYGKRDDPYTVLSHLGRRLEARLAPETALSTIVETVATELKLPYAAISLEQDDEFVVAAEYGNPVDQPIMLPLSYQTEPVGRLILAPRVPGEPFSTSDNKLLEDLTRQAAVTVYAARLTADLQRSRERLVTAREEERRRLRRDLHDGLGPRLAAQTLKAGSARLLYERDPASADALLSELESDIEATLDEIRRLVYDLRPPALDELGLVGAIRDAAERHASQITHGPNVSVRSPDELPPLSAAVEVACYRIVQEALANVIRHARATNCVVRLSVTNGLEIEVSDDGVGILGDHRSGVGLHSMRERAEELGGSCVVRRTATGGTRVLARLPLPDQEKMTPRK